MTSMQVHSGTFGHSGGKISKSRSRTVVKPILKKLHSHHSDRESSLDLDRGWDDQPSPGLAAGSDFGTYDSDGSYHYSTPTGNGARPTRDVSFSFSATDISGSGLNGGGAVGGGSRSKYSHVRSTSGNSHTSSIATTTSGRNGGSFIHPFQQTPHTSTPPLSYANSRASFDNGMPTGYSPTITEDDDDVDPYSSFHSTSTTPRPTLYQSAFYQHPNHRRPSMASQRTSSLSDGNQTTRIPATRTNSGSIHPLASLSLNQSRSELNNSSALSSLAIDSPLSSTAPLGTAGTTLSSIHTSNVSVAPSSTAPLSPLRSSLDMGAFRLRSRSEVDTSTHQEQVREARRKFEAKERAKEEKYAKEQLRKRERAENKEAHKLEKSHNRLRKGSAGHGSVSSSTMSSGTDIRISSSRKHGAMTEDNREKVEFSSHGYDSTHGEQTAPSRADDVHFKSPKRTKTAKHKTMGVWTAFMLWLRTRLLKMGRR
ncbi:hypothetical protein VFPPC_14417 [Pochonia chlamydosporia 170]|uniref:Uncharacterized protein n=1 Tax=Pochonia chlamydosporia 170 TaxID=1380566 RepID=A0A179FNS9_METCM|nr:hypothetical protein VFPPC_14417 [Pochonia chlamydosporia 170]OAQ67007.1 hypothetical protein VFPPC_14417 [Pochonia chlamydosporia 170]